MARSSRITYSINGLKRWSCKSKEIPGVADVKAIHVYDFDNTLFSSPLPNPQIWQNSSIGFLQSYEGFATGGWWHDPTVLGATGEGIEKEEPRAWRDHWNEPVVDLVRLSMQSKDVLNVLLTGRGEALFADLVQRLVNAKQLDFDLVALKPEVSPQGDRFPSTMEFKQAFLRDLIFTYKNAEEIRVYDDRQHHVKGFREFFDRQNKSLLSHPVNEPPPPRKPINAEVIHVCELKASLDPDVEIEVVQRMINRHNQAITTFGPNPHHAKQKCYAIREKFIYCGYLINQNDSSRLIALTKCPPNLIDSGEVRLLASSILISPHPASPPLLQKIGGKGQKVTWQVSGLAKLEDRIWAARVTPISDVVVHTQDLTPFVVLALRKGTRPIDASRINNWNPLAADKQLIFETIVGDKILLNIEEVSENNNGYPTAGGRNTNNARIDKYGGQKRKYAQASNEAFLGRENFPALGDPPVAMHNNERDDGTWIPAGPGFNPQQTNINPGAGNSGGGDRHGQAKYFNQAKQGPPHPRNVSGPMPSQNRGMRQPSGRKSDHHQQHGQENATSGGGKMKTSDRLRQSGPGGGGRGARSGNRGAPAGYKSLDDYGPAGFDGPADVNGAGGNQMVMNY